MTDTSTKPAKMRKANPNSAAIFDLILPSGQRLGDASVADLEAAIGHYAEQGDNRARTMRHLVKLARSFDRAGY